MKKIFLNDREIQQIIVFYERQLKDFEFRKHILQQGLARIQEQNEKPMAEKLVSKVDVTPYIKEPEIIEPVENLFPPKQKKKKIKRTPKGMIILPNIAKTKKIKFDEYGMPYYEKDSD